jgi:integrase
MARSALSIITVQKLKPPASKATRVERYDSAVPGFGVRITAEGSRSWIFVYRSPTQNKRRRYTIGMVDLKEPNGETTFDLDQARAKALALRQLVRKKQDPAEVRLADQVSAEAETVAAAAAADRLTFKSLAEAYVVAELAKKRRGSELERIIHKQLIPPWGARAAADITDLDVEERIKALVDAGKREAARKLFEVIRQIFNWAVAQPTYRKDIRRSPAEGLKALKLCGKKAKRKRILNNDELRAAWHAAGRAGYPFGPMVKMLMLTALRRNEVADASRSEFDLDHDKLWIIPADRMKGEDEDSQPHGVPLTAAMLQIIEQLPELAGGDFLFSSGDGKEPISGFSKMKQRFDRLMLEELRKIATDRKDQGLLAKIARIESLMDALAKATGEDRKPLTAELKKLWYVLHDVRRTVRTHLSALPVEEVVRELILAHTQSTLGEIYNQYSYIDEKRQALELWANRLKLIVDQPPRA